MSSHNLSAPPGPLTQVNLARWYCQAMTLFAFQGAALLATYAMRGWDTDPNSLPLGLQLDARHAVIHLVSGLAGAYFGFVKPQGALRFLQLFTVFYLALAVFGTFTNVHFGLQLELPENTLHWFLGSVGAAISFGPSLIRLVRSRR